MVSGRLLTNERRCIFSIRTELPEIALKKKELELEAAGSPQAPPAAAAAAASAKSSGKVTDLDAIKNKLWSSKTSTPSAGVSALLDDLPSKSRSGFGRETTAANGSNGRTIAFKAWKAGDPSDTDSDSESLVKGGGGVRFADSAKDSDGGGRRKVCFSFFLSLSFSCLPLCINRLS